MADVQKLIRDPRFQSLNFAERDALLSEVSPSFRDAPQEHRVQLLNDMKRQEWWQPKAVEPAVKSVSPAIPSRTTDITRSTLSTGLDTPTTDAMTATPARRAVEPKPAVAPTPAVEPKKPMLFSTVDAAGGVVEAEDDGTAAKVFKPVPALAASQVVTGIGGKIRQFGEDPIGTTLRMNPIEAVKGAVTDYAMAKMGMKKPVLPENAVSRYGKELAQEGEMVQKEIEKSNPLKEGSVGASIRSGLASTYQQIPSIVAGVGAGRLAVGLGEKAATAIGTAVSLLPMGEMTEGSTYQRQREKGFDPSSATASAYLDKVIEVGTEALPTAKFLKTVSGKVKFGLKEIATQFLKYGGEEYVGESIATVTQKMNEKYMDAPNMTTAQRVQKVEDYLTSPEVWKDLAETIKTTTVQNIAMGALGMAGRGATNIASRGKDNDMLNPATETPQVPPTVDEKAHAAATSPLNERPQPSEAQKEAGNYKHGEDIKIPGLPAIKIENPQGSLREGVDPDGTPWANMMMAHYGRFKATEGRDKQGVDVFLKPGMDEKAPGDVAFVIDQIDPKTGKLDEHKIMLGWSTPEEAEAAYLANYDETGPSRIGAVTATTLPEFSAWLKEGNTKQAFAQDRFDKKGNLLQLEGGDTTETIETAGTEDATNAEGQDANEGRQEGLLRFDILGLDQEGNEITLQVEAADAQQAMDKAEMDNPGFSAESATEGVLDAQTGAVQPQGNVEDRGAGQAGPEGLEQAQAESEEVSDLQGMDGSEGERVSVLQPSDEQGGTVQPVTIDESMTYQGTRQAPLMGANDVNLVAKDDQGNDIGRIWYTKKDGGIEIRKIEVDPAFRRRKVATQLRAEAEKRDGKRIGSTDQTPEGKAFTEAYDKNQQQEAPDEITEFQAILDSFEAHGYVTKGKGKKNFYTDSDFQKHVKMFYPSVHGESKRNIIAALKAAIAGKKLTAGQEQVIENFRYDMEGLKRTAAANEDRAAFEARVKEVAQATGTDTTAFSEEDKRALVADYEKWQASQADRPGGETVTEPSEEAAAPASPIFEQTEAGEQGKMFATPPTFGKGTQGKGVVDENPMEAEMRERKAEKAQTGFAFNDTGGYAKEQTVTLYRGDSVNEDGIGNGSMGDLGQGIYFTDSDVSAEYFTDGSDKSHTRPFTVKLRKVFDLMSRDLSNDPTWHRMLETVTGLNRTLLERWARNDLDVKNTYNFLANSFGQTPETFNKFLASYGYDAISDQGIRGVADGGRQYVVFSKSKIKQPKSHGGGTTYADTGGYADRAQPSRPSTATSQTFLELPEMVELAKAINLGKLPKLVKNIARGVLGRFSYKKLTKEAWITLRKDLFAGPLLAEESVKPKDKDAAWLTFQFNVTFNNPDADLLFRQDYNRRTGRWEFRAYHKDPNYVLKTLAHEIGHNVDYLPDDMVKGRGNIFGHIAALKNYMKQTLAMYPDAKGQPLTKEDRERLEKEARATTPKGEDIITTITREVPRYEEAGITPEMIRAIWQDVNGRDKYPELYLFIAKMSDSEKKAIVVQAMKGIVDARLNALKNRRQVGVDIVTEQVVTPAKQRPEAVKRQFEKLLREEILKRRLYEFEVVMDELKAVSQAWKPFDPAQNPEYTKYRYSAAELYADAVSVLANEPQLLKDMAPTFYKAFFYYMGKRPEFRDAYKALSKLSKDPQELGADRYRREMEMYKRGAEEANRLRQEQPDHEKLFDTLMRALVDKNWDVLKELPKDEQGQRVKDSLNEIQYLGGEIGTYVRKVTMTRKALEDSGMTVDDLSAYMLAKHIIANRDSIANTQGKTAATEQAKLDWMRQNFGPEKFAALEQAAEEFKEHREYVLQRIQESGIVTPELMTLIRQNRDYAHIDVQEYMDGQFGTGTAAGAGWKKHAEGTLKDINNVFVATVLQDMSILRMAKINEAKRAITDVFVQSGQVTPAEMKWDKNINGRRPAEPADNTKALLTVLVNGKPVYYVVDKHVADVFKYDPIKATTLGKVFGYVTQFFRDVLVSKNPAWMTRNVYRDFKGTVKNNPEVAWWNPKDRLELIKAYKEAFKEVYKDVMRGERSDDIESMYQNNMLNTDRMFASKETTFDDELTRIAMEFKFGEEYHANVAIRLLQKVYNYLDKLGKVSEQTSKVAGFKYLSQRGLQDKALAHRVRTRIGTPDYRRQGSLQRFSNSIFLFSNVNKEGIRSAVEAAKEDPISYAMKTLSSNLLPKLLLGIAAAGLFGDEIKKIVEKIPSWDRRTYNVIPIPNVMTRELKERGIIGKDAAVYLRLPQDYEGQFFGSLAYDLTQGDFQGVMSDIKGGQPYRWHPVIDATLNWFSYMSGGNPTDSFRQREILTREQQKYHEVEGNLNDKAIEGMAKYTWNALGLGNLYKMDNKEFPKDLTITEKTLKTFPLNAIGTYLTVTDAGHQEQLSKKIFDARDKKAIASYEVGDRINEAVREGKITIPQRRALYFELSNKGMINPKTYTIGRFNSQFGRAIEQKQHGIKPLSKKESTVLQQED